MKYNYLLYLKGGFEVVTKKYFKSKLLILVLLVLIFIGGCDPEDLTIESYQELERIDVPFGTEGQQVINNYLPLEVLLYFSDGSQVEGEVSWNIPTNYNPEESGKTFLFKGDALYNEKIIEVEVEVYIKEKLLINLSGDKNIDKNLPGGIYTASLNQNIAGVKIIFNLNDFMAEDIRSINIGEIYQLVNEGITLETDSEGKAVLEIEFNEELNKEGNLTAIINDPDIYSHDTANLHITVDTTPEIIPEYNLNLISNPQEGGITTDETDNAPYVAGERVLISAEANKGYIFNNWTTTESIVSTDKSFEYIMPEKDITLYANFDVLYPDELDISVVPGSISVNIDSIKDNKGNYITFADTKDIFGLKKSDSYIIFNDSQNTVSLNLDDNAITIDMEDDSNKLIINTDDPVFADFSLTNFNGNESVEVQVAGKFTDFNWNINDKVTGLDNISVDTAKKVLQEAEIKGYTEHNILNTVENIINDFVTGVNINMFNTENTDIINHNGQIVGPGSCEVEFILQKGEESLQTGWLNVTALPRASSVNLTGEKEVRSSYESKSVSYKASLDQSIADVEVLFKLNGFAENDINYVSGGEVYQLLDQGIMVKTDEDGKADLNIEFTAGVKQSGTLDASISILDSLVSQDFIDSLEVDVDTMAKVVEISLTGDELLEADNQTIKGTYTASTDIALSGVNVLFTLEGFDETDIIYLSNGDIDDLLNNGINIETDSSGEAELEIEFPEGIAETGIISVSISEEDPLVNSNDTATKEININTLTKVNEVNLSGDQTLLANNENITGGYTAELDKNVEGVNIRFELKEFAKEDIVSVSTGNVEDLINDGITISSDDQGEAFLGITFAAGVDKEGTIQVFIEKEDLQVKDDAEDVLILSVNTGIKYNLNIDITGEGTTDPEAGNHIYPEGEEVTVTAYPADGYDFAEWTGDISETEEEITITLDKDMDIRAVFTEKVYNLDLEVSPVEGGTAFDLTDTGPYPEGAEIDISTIAAEGYQFAQWTAVSGVLADENEPKTIFTMPAEDVTVTANFDRIHQLTVNVEGQGTTSPEEGIHTFIEGEKITITAQPEEGHEFVEWIGDITGTEETITFNMDQDIQLTAVFREYPVLTLEVSSEGWGTATVVFGEAGPYPTGTEVRIRAEAETGFVFDKWTAPVGEFSSVFDDSPIFTMPGEDVTVTANFLPFTFETFPERTITDYNTEAGLDVIIPATINSWDVEVIGLNAFADKGIESVVIPEGIKTIKENAFQNNNLSEIVLPDSVNTVERRAFRNNQIEDLVLSENISVISPRAFDNNLISYLDLPEGINSIESYAFNSNRLTEIEIPDGITAISDGVFANNLLEELYMSEQIKSIGNSAFSNNQLEVLVLPDGLEDLGPHSFKGNKLTEVTIPDNLGVITREVFMDNQIHTINFGTNVEIIEVGAFKNNQLEELQLPPGVIRIEGGFDFSPGAFENNLIAELNLDPEPFELPNINYIGANAFRNNQLTTVIIPESVIDIGQFAFAENQLNDVSWTDDGLENIEGSAFRENMLTEITLPTSLKTIGDRAFKDNKLENLTIPDQVEYIGLRAFRNNNLREITFLPGIPLTQIGAYTFENNQIDTEVNLPENLEVIGDYAFSNNQIPEIKFGANLHTIGSYAFTDNKMVSLVLPDSVANLGSGAFSNNELTEAVFGSGITELPASLFARNNFNHVYLPDHIEVVGGWAFHENEVDFIIIGANVDIVNSLSMGDYGSGFLSKYEEFNYAAGWYERIDGEWEKIQ